MSLIVIVMLTAVTGYLLGALTILACGRHLVKRKREVDAERKKVDSKKEEQLKKDQEMFTDLRDNLIKH